MVKKVKEESVKNWLPEEIKKDLRKLPGERDGPSIIANSLGNAISAQLEAEFDNLGDGETILFTRTYPALNLEKMASALKVDWDEDIGVSEIVEVLACNVGDQLPNAHMPLGSEPPIVVIDGKLDLTKLAEFLRKHFVFIFRDPDKGGEEEGG